MSGRTVFLIAGEPSGDFLGSQLMKALKSELGPHVTFLGVGGPLMTAEGLSSLFPIDELSVMGLAEVIPHIWRIRRRIQETVEAIAAAHPHVVVTIDSPGFNFRVGKALKARDKSIPLVHYVAPSVWAWRPGRAKSVAKFLDHLLTLFPFEPPYFLKEGLPTHFVGHPVVELGLENTSDPTFRNRHKIPVTAPILTLLPGSRRGEISRLLPVFQDTVTLLKIKYPDLRVVIPTLPHLVTQIRQLFVLPATILTTQDEKFAAYKESHAALAASGTVSLELAVVGLPMVIAYKLNALTHFIVERLVKVTYACLVNLLLKKEVIPEYLQSECKPENLSKALEKLLQKEGRGQMLLDMKRASSLLHAPESGLSPSQCAAKHICEVMGSKTSF
jgi:lipid-A-disaccharide synthase